MIEHMKVCLTPDLSSIPLLYIVFHSRDHCRVAGNTALESVRLVHCSGYLMLHYKPSRSLWPETTVLFILLRNLQFGQGLWGYLYLLCHCLLGRLKVQGRGLSEGSAAHMSGMWCWLLA